LTPHLTPKGPPFLEGFRPLPERATGREATPACPEAEQAILRRHGVLPQDRRERPARIGRDPARLGSEAQQFTPIVVLVPDHLIELDLGRHANPSRRPDI